MMVDPFITGWWWHLLLHRLFWELFHDRFPQSCFTRSSKIFLGLGFILVCVGNKSNKLIPLYQLNVKDMGIRMWTTQVLGWEVRKTYMCIWSLCPGWFSKLDSKSFVDARNICFGMWGGFHDIPLINTCMRFIITSKDLVMIIKLQNCTFRTKNVRFLALHHICFKSLYLVRNLSVACSHA